MHALKHATKGTDGVRTLRENADVRSRMLGEDDVPGHSRFGAIVDPLRAHV
jgi:hypothetical protein